MDVVLTNGHGRVAVARIALCLSTLMLLLGLTPVTAARQEATPANAVGTLLDITIDRAQLPGDVGFVLMGRNVAEPGSRHTYFNPDDVGTIVIVVESGVVTYEIDGTGGRIVRGANTASPAEETAPEKTPFTLAPGDAVVYPAQRRVEGNQGDVPAVFLFAVILEPVGPPEPDPTDVGEITSEILAESSGAWPDMPSGPVNLTLRATSLGDGEMLPAPAGGLQTVDQVSGNATGLIVADNGTLNLGDEAAQLLVLSLAPMTAAPATPAVRASSGTPTAGMPAEVLLDVTIPAEVMPTGPAFAEFGSSTWSPGDEAMFPEWHPAVSIEAEVVFSGEYGAKSAAGIVASRDGRMENVSPGQEVVLNAGDGLLYLDNAADQWVRNAGAADTEIATFILTSSEDLIGPNLGVDWEQSGLSGSDVRLTVEQQTIAPGETLPAVSPNPAEPTLHLVHAGQLEWTFIWPDDRGVAPPLQFGPGSVVPFVAPARGGQIELRNAGNEPLVLVTLTLVRAEHAGATPTS
jgi:hypothetical protein